MCLKYLKWVRQLKMDITNSVNDGRIIIIPEKIYNITVGMERDI